MDSGCYKLVLFISLIVLFSGIAEADTITAKYNFDEPQIIDVNLDGALYHKVILENSPNGGTQGEPLVPSRGGKILIPAGHTVTDVSIKSGKKLHLGSNYKIIPAQKLYLLSRKSYENVFTHPDPRIYAQTNEYPGNLFENIGLQNCRGFQVLIIKLNPVQYIPASGDLYFYPEMKVKVTTSDTETSSDLYRGLYKDLDEIRKTVDNPEFVKSYSSQLSLSNDVYDLMILTSNDLAPAYQRLKDYHDTTGITTEIHTIEEVGSTDPIAIRNYIRNQYLTNGISYVLIGADQEIIPAPFYFYIVDFDNPLPGEDINREGEEVYDLCTDIYYACLDGTVDYDNDGKWAEPGDGENGGEIDLMAEVFVGRACTDNVNEVNYFIDKTILYDTITDPYLFKILLAGEHLGFGGESEYSYLSLEEMIGDTDTDGYYTIGFPEDYTHFYKLYDINYSPGFWSGSTLIDSLNNNFHLLQHDGHCNENYCMRLTVYNIDEYENDLPFFAYSIGCYAGNFANNAYGEDCIAEHLSVKTPHAAFADIMNASYGVGEYNSTDGPSQRYAREFWDAVYNPNENKPQIGVANQDSKEDNLYRINEDGMRSVYYQLTVFGDPTIKIKKPVDCEYWQDTDYDDDKVCDSHDNCPDVYNPDQIDEELNGLGDACDTILHIYCVDIPDGYNGQEYNYQLSATGGVPPYFWTKLSGQIPYGLQMDQDGNLTGIPTFSSEFTFRVELVDSDIVAKFDTGYVVVRIVDPPLECGDVNSDYNVDIADAVFLINYIFVPASQEPNPLMISDVNCDETVSMVDIVYLINYVFRMGSDPCSQCLQ